MMKQTGSFLTFRLGDELFAVDVAHVREILDLVEITAVPTAPSFMRGVVNVRGAAVPAVDLRTKFGLPAVATSPRTRIVVLEFELDGEQVTVGGLADSVHDVVELAPGDMAEPPRIAMRWRAELIHGICRRGEQFIILLDIDKVLGAHDLALLVEDQPAAETAVG
jgi:purine-binding chemotaxis protein CheW